jgi:hypothetical protein
MNRSVFLSYSRHDGSFARRLRKALTAREVSVWSPEVDLRAGQVFDKALRQAMERSDAVLVLISEASITSPNTNFELGAAAGTGKPVLLMFLSEHARNKFEVPSWFRAHRSLVNPRSHAKAADAVIHELQRIDEEEMGNGEVVAVPGNGEWTRDMVRQLKDSLHYPGPRAMLDMTAERPGEPVRFAEVLERSGRSAKQVAAELGAMSKLARRLFDGQKVWPVTWSQASDGSRYVMKSRIAAWWREA